MRTRNLGALACALLVALALAGCGKASAAAPSPPTQGLLGTWYESASGAEYQFLGDSIVIVPQKQANGGNAATYRIVGGNTLDIVSANSHHVSIIQSITADSMVLADPLGGFTQHFCRTLTQTNRVRSLEASALAAVSEFATTAPEPEIVWVAPKPTGKGTEWVDWAPTTLSVYATAWEWTTLKRDRTPVRSAGTGEARGYSFTFTRPVPSAEKLDEVREESSIEATAGLPRIDVGYSASKAQYSAGTFVYLPGGLVYSLGNGFAIPVGFDWKHESFVPLTHK
jgi:hypothetical protein